MNKFDPAELLSLYVAMAYAKGHISQEFACASQVSGAGSSEREPFYLTPAQQYARETGAFLQRTGRAPLGVHIGREEESWFTAEDRDEAWIASQDPKHWK